MQPAALDYFADCSNRGAREKLRTIAEQCNAAGISQVRFAVRVAGRCLATRP